MTQLRMARIAATLFLLFTTVGVPARAAMKDEEAVRSVLQLNARAFEQKDMKSLDSIWAHDADVSVFENGYANYGWSDYRDHHLKPEVEDMRNVTYRLADVKTHVAGDTAWSTFKYTIRADYEGRTIDSAGLGTAILEKRSGAWKIVHWHTSAPRTKPAAPAGK